MPIRRFVLALLVLGCWSPDAPRAEQGLSAEAVDGLVRELFTPEPLIRRQALGVLRNRGKLDVVPGLILALQDLVGVGPLAAGPSRDRAVRGLRCLQGRRDGGDRPELPRLPASRGRA